jgi:glycosyltransferase involved in cell wall biosynthesis
VGGSDDHAGVDVGRTWTETPPAPTAEEFLRHLREGETAAGGAQGSAEKWAHAAMALAVRALGRGDAGAQPDPRAVFAMVSQAMSQASTRSGPLAAGLGPADARALLRAWLDAVGMDLSEQELLAAMQADGFSHAELFRRARRKHERDLRAAVERVVAAGERDGAPLADRLLPLAAGVFTACVPAIPYAPAAAFLGREKGKLIGREGDPHRVALVADGVGSVHGVTRTLDEIRERGVPGFEIDVIGTDASVDRRLPAVAEVDVPLYPGLRVGVPSLPAAVEAIADGRYELIHVCSPGPAGVAAALIARTMELPLVGSYHTELGAYAGLRSGEGRLRAGMDMALAALYGRCSTVLSPSEPADGSLRALGVAPELIERWERGVNVSRFHPSMRRPGLHPGELTVLYAGRLSAEKGATLLADAFLGARARDPRLHLVLAGGGPEEEALRERLGPHATFLGWLEGEALARAYASADLLVFASATDTFGQVVLEAQASGLPVVAVDAGGPRSLIEDGRTGLLRAPPRLADGIGELAGSPALRRRLAAGALAGARGRTWERSLAQLADGYRRALAGSDAARRVAA